PTPPPAPFILARLSAPRCVAPPHPLNSHPPTAAVPAPGGRVGPTDLDSRVAFRRKRNADDRTDRRGARGDRAGHRPGPGTGAAGLRAHPAGAWPAWRAALPGP